jgi:hypothetical protein
VKPPHYVKQLGTQTGLYVNWAVVILCSITLSQKPSVHEMPPIAAMIHLLRDALLPVVEVPVTTIWL